MSNYEWNFGKAWPDLHGRALPLWANMTVYVNGVRDREAQLALDGSTYWIPVSGELLQDINDGKIYAKPVFTNEADNKIELIAIDLRPATK